MSDGATEMLREERTARLDPFEIGRTAAHEGRTIYANPYAAPGNGVYDYINWQRGWCFEHQQHQLTEDPPIPDTELPGMWPHSDFTGGKED